MALLDNAWYVDYGDGSTTGYYAVAQWTALTSYDAGALIRQLAAPAVGSERVFVAVVGHVASGASEPSWTLTRGAKTTDATITWQEATGVAALNGDVTGSNTPKWNNASIKNTAITLGQVITDVAQTIVLICTTAGTAGNGAEPSWAAYTTAGATTADNTVTWTNVGAVGNFTGWQAPHARLANAFVLTWGAPGNTFYVASEHAETQASALTLTPPATAGTICKIYCVTKTTVPPTSANLTTGATISTTGANNISTSGTGWAYWQGLTFQAGSGSSNGTFNLGAASNQYYDFKSCSFTLNSTAAAARFNLCNAAGGNSIKLVFDTCTFTFGSAVGQSFTASAAGAAAILRNCTINVGANIPTTAFGAVVPVFLMEGCDLSAFGSGKTLIGASGVVTQTIIKDCKLGASVTIATTPTTANTRTDVIRSDSSGTNYRQESYQYTGTLTNETTIIRTGGASDGTTGISWKIVTTANSAWILPFDCIPIQIWNDVSGSAVTVTVYGTTTGGGVPKDDEIWADVVYLKDSGDAQGGFATSTKADNLAASVATNNSSDGSTWGGGGAGNGFKIAVPSFTPQQKGYLTIYVKAAKVSSTFYIDPKVALS